MKYYQYFNMLKTCILEKLSDIPKEDSTTKIEVVNVITGIFVGKPYIGEKFYLGWSYKTSKIKEIIQENIFKTEDGSIYRFNILENNIIIKKS